MPTTTLRRLRAPVSRRSFAHATRAVTAMLGLVLLPKCPLCIAAYLASFGLGAGAAAFAAPLVRPLGWLLATTACAALVHGWWRHARARRPEAGRQSAGGCRCA
jgi:hypothetical protein